MREQKVTVGEGPPIASTSSDQLKRQGAADGAAAKVRGMSARDCAAVVAKRLAAEVTLVVHLTLMRHIKAIGEANVKVVVSSNKLAPVAQALSAKEVELAQAEAAHRGFLQRIMDLFDRRLTLPHAASEPEIRNSFAGSADPNDADPGGRNRQNPEPLAKSGDEAALRYAWRRGLSPWAVWVFLGLVAGAEFGLNSKAFASTRDQESIVLLLAALIGVAMMGLSHRIGDNAAHVLEQPRGAKGRSPAKLVELCFEVPALIVGIVGVATIRASYFHIKHISIPTPGLVALQLMLAAAAVGVTMAGHSEAADELRDRRRCRDDLAYAVRKLTKPYLEAQQELVVAEGLERYALSDLVVDYGVQVSHVQRTFADCYLHAFNDAAGEHLGTEALPEVEPPALVVQAIAWLAAHPVGTLGHLEFPYSSAPGAQAEALEEDSIEDRKPETQRTLFDMSPLDEDEEAA